MHPWSFRDHLVFSIGFALARSRDLLRRVLREHAPDDAKQELAERVVKHLEQSGFELDEECQALRKRPVAAWDGARRIAALAQGLAGRGFGFSRSTPGLLVDARRGPVQLIAKSVGVLPLAMARV